MNWGAMSRAERDAAYDNIGAVTDSAALNAAREVASAAFRAAIRSISICATGSASATPGTCSRPPDPNAPCLVFIHGGYWQRNSKDQFANLIARPLCAWLGGGAARLYAGAGCVDDRDRRPRSTRRWTGWPSTDRRMGSTGRSCCPAGRRAGI